MYNLYMTEIAFSDARNRLADVITETSQSGEPISVTRRGRRVAVILDADAFDELVDRRELDAPSHNTSQRNQQRHSKATAAATCHPADSIRLHVHERRGGLPTSAL